MCFLSLSFCRSFITRIITAYIRGVHGNGNFNSHRIPMGMFLFPWDSHWNGSSFGLLMGMEMEIVLMGMGITYFIGEK